MVRSLRDPEYDRGYDDGRQVGLEEGRREGWREGREELLAQGYAEELAQRGMEEKNKAYSRGYEAGRLEVEGTAIETGREGKREGFAFSLRDTKKVRRREVFAHLRSTGKREGKLRVRLREDSLWSLGRVIPRFLASTEFERLAEIVGVRELQTPHPAPAATSRAAIPASRRGRRPHRLADLDLNRCRQRLFKLTGV